MKIDFNNMKETFIIAEIGSNHNQDIELAKDMILAAKECGADAVKFQSLNVKELYYSPSDSIKELHKKIDFQENWHQILKQYCDDNSIIFFSAPTYLKAIDILEKINVSLYKLASAQVGTFPQLIKKVADIKKPTLLSTGIVTYGELEKAVNIFKDVKNENFAILHCNSLYPTPYEKANIHLINVYKQMFNKTVGYSDHTEGIYIALAAVAMGAKIIEKHFTIDKKIPVPDAEISIEPDEFKEMVYGIRAVEKSLISKDRTFLEQDEEIFKKQILYRLILKKNKVKGEIFKYGDFEYKRTYEGIDCRYEDLIINNFKAKYDLNKNELLRWKDLQGV